MVSLGSTRGINAACCCSPCGLMRGRGAGIIALDAITGLWVDFGGELASLSTFPDSVPAGSAEGLWQHFLQLCFCVELARLCKPGLLWFSKARGAARNILRHLWLFDRNGRLGYGWCGTCFNFLRRDGRL